MNKKEVTKSRFIKLSTKCLLWGKSAGRCQFDGCNKPLWESEATKEQVNIGEHAHIWSFSDDGPRGNSGINNKDINSICNLMLLCQQCHKLIDDDKKGEKYPVELLQKMKQKHEERIDLAASIATYKNSHILLYGANIGAHSSPVSYRNAAEAIFPEFYPANSTPLKLGLDGSHFADNEDIYWLTEKASLERKFSNIVQPGLSNNEIQHLSVFGLAPQPLLILLGKLLSDIPAAEVYQRHREPQTWIWQNDQPDIPYQILRPSNLKPTAAINFSISATINNERIHHVLGNDVSIWTVTIPAPNNDFMRSKSQLKLFREALRPLMDEIKKHYGSNHTLHIFPALPVSAAIEIGRTYMPKADMSLSLYDQSKDSGSFIKAFDL